MEEESVPHPNHLHPLTPCVISLCVMCAVADSSSVDGYMCGTCDFACHKACSESPREMKHPYHPPHSIFLRPIDEALLQAEAKCSFCGEKLFLGWVYDCPLCKFFIHLRCAKEPPVLEVEHPKSHEHKLFLLPTPLAFSCNACGLNDSCSLPYVCLQCGVMLHKRCVHLPRLIRISRHQHRLCYTPSLPPPQRQQRYCGVCRKVIDNNYGMYSCSKGCHYAVHSKCATREDVWDGKDLDGEPEEPEDVEATFEVIDGKTIRHFSHVHHLKLNQDDGDGFDGRKHCQACALPIHILFGKFYSCMLCDCDFILHEKCANLPRRIWHMQHPHSLKLTIAANLSFCYVCERYSCGFMYTCCETGCYFQTDVDCASVSEPLIHKGHPHPLFSTSLHDAHVCSGIHGEVQIRQASSDPSRR